MYPRQNYDVKVGQIYGTTYRIVTDKENTIMPEVNQEFQKITEQLSVFNKDSELNKINNAKVGKEIKISPTLASILMKSKEFYKKTDGNFDPSTGKLIDLWGFGVDDNKEPPTDEDIEKSLASIGMDKLEVNGNSIKKMHNDFHLNLSAIAKGYAVDRISTLLGYMGYENYLIEIGGEIYVKGNRKFMEHGWNVAIKNPITKDVLLPINISNIGIATSGDYEKFIEIDGNKFSHIINPKTGKPMSSNLASVSVFADDVMTADVYATAIMVMGKDAGLEFANKNEIMAIFITIENDTLKITKSNENSSFWNTEVKFLENKQ